MATRQRTVMAEVLCQYPTDTEPWATLRVSATAVSMIRNRISAIEDEDAQAWVRIPVLDATYSFDEFIALPWVQDALVSGDAV